MAGRPPCILTRSENLASSPIATKAKANQTVRNAFKHPLTCLRVSAGIRNEKINDAAIKPNTNLGNRSHITPIPLPSVLSDDAGFFFTIHQAAIKKAATPINTFCENFIITPAFNAAPRVAPLLLPMLLYRACPPTMLLLLSPVFQNS